MAAQKTVSRRTAWTNLVVCGGISWGVNVWHAWNTPKPGTGGHAVHSTIAGAHISPTLALLYGTAPVVVAAFQSHNIAHAGGGTFKKVLTFAVFALGMALSIYAQAAAVAPIAGEVLKWVFPIMLDLSAFMALHSIMAPVETASLERSSSVSEGSSPAYFGASPAASPGASPRASLERPGERLSDARVNVSQTVQQTPTQASPETPKRSTQGRSPAPRKTPAKKSATPAEDTRTKARRILKENPDMSAADLARALNRKPGGTYREMKTELLTELAEAGEIQRVRAVGA